MSEAPPAELHACLRGIALPRAHRVVEAQHIVSTRKLVASAAEQALLEELLEGSKPPLPGDTAGLHYLLATPFRYPPLRHGSRFGTRFERGIWYGATTQATAFAEVAYYRFLFVEGSAARLLPLTVELSAFWAPVASPRGLDLTAPPFDRQREAIASPTAYDASQRLGAEMRAAGVELFLYPSARCPRGGTNVGLMSPAAIDARTPKGQQVWSCLVTADAVELRRRDLVRLRTLLFPRETFLVDGRLPHPAV